MSKLDLLHDLTPEQIEKLKSCENKDELLALAKAEGVELTDEQLDAVSGGCGTKVAQDEICPQCGSTDLVYHDILIGLEFTCKTCGHKYRKYADPLS